MSLQFDRFCMVDWSAASVPVRGADSIWIAHCRAGGADMAVRNEPTRSRAMDWIAGAIDRALAAGARLLLGFDFAFGYPAGLCARLGVPDWRGVWAFLRDALRDEDDNANDRFALAARLNRTAFADVSEGPFWGHPPKARHESLLPKRPPYDAVAERRLVERRVRSAQPVWKLAYTGAVGSQTLTGIARLEGLRRRYRGPIAIWPFETDFAHNCARPVVICEIYPSLLPLETRQGEVKDAAQVRTVAHHAASLSTAERLHDWLAEPMGLRENEREVVLREEGWIAGAPR